MKTCANCGSEVLDNAKFCNNCGSEIVEEETVDSTSQNKCPNCGEEIDERMKQLKYETVENSLFISGEEFCNKYINSLLEKSHEKYAEFIAQMCDYDELIIKHAQFLKGKDNTIEILKTILAIREDMQKTTAIFSDEELMF